MLEIEGQRENEQRIGYNKVTQKAALTVLAGWGIFLIIGEQLAWGNQSTYIASYFRMLGNEVSMEEFYLV